MDNRGQFAGASWINFLAGIWLILSPFVLGNFSTQAFWNNIIVGAIVLVLSFSSVMPRGGGGTTIERQ